MRRRRRRRLVQLLGGGENMMRASRESLDLTATTKLRKFLNFAPRSLVQQRPRMRNDLMTGNSLSREFPPPTGCGSNVSRMFSFSVFQEVSDLFTQ